jgi:hypothetical protein
MKNLSRLARCLLARPPPAIRKEAMAMTLTTNQILGSSTMKKDDIASDQNLFGINLQRKVANTPSKLNLLEDAVAEHVKSPVEIVRSVSEETAKNSLMARSHWPSGQNREKEQRLGFQEQGSKGNQKITDINSFRPQKRASRSESPRKVPVLIVEKDSPEEKMVQEFSKKVREIMGGSDPYEFYKAKMLELLGKFFLQDESFEVLIRRKTFSEKDDHVPAGLAKVSELLVAESGDLSLLLEWNGDYAVIGDRLEASRVKF